MIGFIGCGNMATAIIRGLVSSGKYNTKDIAVYDICREKAETFAKELSLTVTESEKEIAEKCDTVVLSVKPDVFPSLLGKIGEELKANDPLIISIAAGKTTEFISSLLPYSPRLVRIMPNINAKVQAAISAYCGNERATDSDKSYVKEFCDSFGRGMEIAEKNFSIYSAIGGCSPAFAFMFIDSLAMAAVKNGMTKAQALEAAAQAVLGSAKLILESDDHPRKLVDAVCSPGGTTIEGVCALQEKGFEAAVEAAVEAAYNKDKRL
ncbi:MAG: pyrroline-5-carboxylate reductase [Clostridia bacterium]|nr:pyrroline-5-carboxylate reductase [Clostridia bacterium]